MLTIGLVLGGEYSRYCALDADGRVVEEGQAPGAEAGFRRRFASMPPSIFAVEYNPAGRRLYAALTGQGQTVYFSGPAPEWMKPVFAADARAIARQNGGPAFVVTRYAADDGTGLRLTLSIDAAGDVTGAWYFIGPVGEGVDCAALPAGPLADANGSASGPSRDREGADIALAREQARRLAALVRCDRSCQNTAPSWSRLRIGVLNRAQQQAVRTESVA